MLHRAEQVGHVRQLLHRPALAQDEIAHDPVEEPVDFFFVVTTRRVVPNLECLIRSTSSRTASGTSRSDPGPWTRCASSPTRRSTSRGAYPVRHVVRGKVTARTSAGEGGAPPRSSARRPSRKESTSEMRYPGSSLASQSFAVSSK